jgi:hypothetical protein
MLFHVQSHEMTFTFPLTDLNWDKLPSSDYIGTRALMGRCCMRLAKMWTHPMKGFTVGLSTPVSLLHIFILSVHRNTN